MSNKSITKNESIKLSNSEPSKKLLRLIELLNLIPVRVIDRQGIFYESVLKNKGISPTSLIPDVPEMNELVDLIDYVNLERFFDEHTERAPKEAVERYLHFLPMPIQQYLFDQINSDKIELLPYFYDELIQTYRKLRQLLETRFYNPAKSREVFFFRFYLPIKCLLVTNDDITDVIEIRKSFIAEALEGVSLKRLRICPICQKFFWARQLNMTACSKSCANVRRVRKWREKSTEYKYNRFINEQKRARK